ncbi:MAG: NAD-dependent epimerase/dehydratase family protein, partial [Bacteroidetes bacterium]|nr:NAD-dependent epimerase/dehydratase family protein [Bacteroidota bacterium]
NILEACRLHKPKHLIFASSSSVYGLNSVYPFNEDHSTDHPISLYAATKKANEMMAHTYAHLFQIPVSGLRFFTVYGPWGRPDMAPILFAKNILNHKPIDVFNEGEMYRDFTYVEDIAESIYKLLDIIPAIKNIDTDKLPSSESSAPYKIYNIGNNNPVKLVDFIDEMESALGTEAVRNMKPIQPGDVVKTYADSSSLYSAINFRPSTTLHDGIAEFAYWYKGYHDKL